MPMLVVFIAAHNVARVDGDAGRVWRQVEVGLAFGDPEVVAIGVGDAEVAQRPWSGL